MKRPLFLVCLCLVLMVWLFRGETESGVETGGGGETEGGGVETVAFGEAQSTVPEQSPLHGNQYIVTGQVCQKDTDYFYLDSIILEQEAAIQQQPIPFTEKLICEYPRDFDDTQVLLGSRVKVCGTFLAFSEATNPGEFDMKKYYHSIKIGGKLRQVTVLDRGLDYSEWRETLHRCKSYFHTRLYQIFPEQEASVMCTMLLGEKKVLDSEIKELYKRNGIIHILSISGLHITIIGMSIYRMLRRTGMPAWIAALLGGSVLLLYGLMTGMGVSAVRAIGMYLLKMFSEIVGRTYDMLTALGIMAFLVVYGNPGYLDNAGFYLSFGAVLGIGAVYPALLPTPKETVLLRYEEHRWKLAGRKIAEKYGKGLQQSILAGLSITLTTLPVQLWFYYEIPVYSVFLNLLVLPFMSLVMIAGMLAMLVPGLGILGTIDCLILSGYERLCLWCERLPFHTWNPGKPNIWQVVVYYVILFGFVWVKNRMRHQKIPGERKRMKEWFYKMVQIGVLTMTVMFLTIHFGKKTSVTFLDVGQGDCICVQTASGEVYLFDCGSSSRSEVGKYVLKPFLKYYGIRHIDAVFLSHSDSDHCNGAEELIDQSEEWGITVGRVFLPGDIGTGDSWQCKVKDGFFDRLIGHKEETVYFTCLHPDLKDKLEGSNADSQCFYIELENGITILLTGDVEGSGEESLLQELQKRQISRVSVLKVAHHGSRYSTSEALLEQIKPEVAVISCGENNRYGHPHAETLERLSDTSFTVLRTDEFGAIEIEEEGEYAKVVGYRK